jgi:hypothetical protein
VILHEPRGKFLGRKWSSKVFSIHKCCATGRSIARTHMASHVYSSRTRSLPTWQYWMMGIACIPCHAPFDMRASRPPPDRLPTASRPPPDRLSPPRYPFAVAVAAHATDALSNQHPRTRHPTHPAPRTPHPAPRTPHTTHHTPHWPGRTSHRHPNARRCSFLSKCN